ncbi:hypothetical protein ACFL1B_04700 [Nanoarchaeota archaeon]
MVSRNKLDLALVVIAPLVIWGAYKLRNSDYVTQDEPRYVATACTMDGDDLVAQVVNQSQPAISITQHANPDLDLAAQGNAKIVAFIPNTQVGYTKDDLKHFSPEQLRMLRFDDNFERNCGNYSNDRGYLAVDPLTLDKRLAIASNTLFVDEEQP